MFSNKIHIIVGTIAFTLVTFTIAYAAHTTINTANNQVDTNWSNVSVHSNDGDDIGNNNYDIDQAWIANEAATSGGFYFRVNLVGTGQLPHDYSSFEARLDCNQNGSFSDSVDVVVYYAIDGATEELVECQGDEYPSCDYATPPNFSDTNDASFGEEIADATYNYEWRADPDSGDTDWSQCFGAIDVQFTSLNSSFTVQDSTVVRAYSAPTSIILADFTAKHELINIFMLVGVILLLVVMIWVAKRMSKRPNPTLT